MDKKTQKSITVGPSQKLLALPDASYDLAVTIEPNTTTTIHEILTLTQDCTQNLELSIHAESSITYLCRIESSEQKNSIEKRLTINLIGAHAHAHVRIYYHGKNNQSFALTVKQRHAADNTTSNILIKNLLCDAAACSCAGIINVEKETKGSHATLYIKNLMIGSAAKATAIPQLEIATYDVVCKHGATCETINPINLFYLQSRGIPCHSAQSMLLKSFLNG